VRHEAPIDANSVAESYFYYDQTQSVGVSSATTDINYNHNIERRFEYDATGRQTASLDVINGGTQVSGQVSEYNIKLFSIKNFT
jgi:hypothetical protein